MGKEVVAPHRIVTTSHSGHRRLSTCFRASLPSRPSALEAAAARLSRYLRVIIAQGCSETEVLVPIPHSWLPHCLLGRNDPAPTPITSYPGAVCRAHVHLPSLWDAPMHFLPGSTPVRKLGKEAWLALGWNGVGPMGGCGLRARVRSLSLQQKPRAQLPTTWKTATIRASHLLLELSFKGCAGPSATRQAPSAHCRPICMDCKADLP